MLPRQKHSPVNRDRQASVPPADHNRAQDQLAQHVPAAAEAVCCVRQPDADADATVGRDDLEDDVENGIRDRIALELARFSNHDKEHCEHNPPQIMSQLAPELLTEEVAPRFGVVSSGDDFAPQFAEEVVVGLGGFLLGVIIVDPETALLIHVAIPHRDYEGIGRYVHHQDVEGQEANAKLANWDNVKPPASYSECLEKTIDCSDTGGEI